MKYGLIGEKLGHSFSPEIHSKIADYIYELKEISKEEIETFFKQKDFCGINVTIPYKQTVLPFLDFIDNSALKIGAVNTVVNKDGKLCGYNTDFGGLLALFKKFVNTLEGKKVLVLGTGGASRAAVAVAETLNSKEIYIVSRTPDANKISYSDALNYHSDASIIINTTPVGMYPNVDDRLIDVSKFTGLELVVDAIYNPLKTNLIIDAENLGIPSIGGLYMLVAQAVFAAGHFLDCEFSADIIDSIYNNLLKSKQNIVLTGMPGSGKSTIGNYLSKITGREFIDTDSLIVMKTGKEISEIFSLYGEKGFRDIESDIIKKVSLKNGAIISTGGGVILREENITNLKHNGKIFFLDRALSELISTPDRPLANSNEAIIKRYNERINIYNSTCDISVKVINPQITGDEILKNF